MSQRNVWEVLLAVNGDGAAADEQLKLASDKLGHQPEMGPTSGNRKQTEGLIDEQVGGTSMDAKAILHTKGMEAAGIELEGRTWDDPREAANARNLGVAAGGTPKHPIDGSRHNTNPTNRNLPRPVHVTKAAAEVIEKIAAKRKAKAAPGRVAKAKKAVGKAAKSVGEKSKGAWASAKKLVKKHPYAAAGAGAALLAGGAYAGHRASKKEASEYTLADHWTLIEQGPDAVKYASENVAPEAYLPVQKLAGQAYLMGVNLGIGMLKEAAGIPVSVEGDEEGADEAQKIASVGAVGILDEDEVAAALEAAHAAKVDSLSDEEAQAIVEGMANDGGAEVEIKTAEDGEAFGRLSFHGQSDVIKLAGELMEEYESESVIAHLEDLRDKLAAEIEAIEAPESDEVVDALGAIAESDPEAVQAFVNQWAAENAGSDDVAEDTEGAEGDQE